MSFWWIRYLAFGLAIALILYFMMIPVMLGKETESDRSRSFVFRKMGFSSVRD